MILIIIYIEVAVILPKLLPRAHYVTYWNNPLEKLGEIAVFN